MATLNRSLLRTMASERMDDVRALISTGRYAAAYYLAGYVIEYGIKACFAAQVQQHDFPEKGKWDQVFQHNLLELIKVAALPLEVDCIADKALRENWGAVKDWNPRCRYDPLWLDDPTAAQHKAEAIVNAIDDPEHGVLKWLQKYW